MRTGSLSSATATANVVNGSLGFAGTVTTLKVVSIKDTNNGSVSTTDDKNYLGVQISGLTADLIGLESILQFHASGVNVKVNKATDTDNNVATVPAKVDWTTFFDNTTGLVIEMCGTGASGSDLNLCHAIQALVLSGHLSRSVPDLPWPTGLDVSGLSGVNFSHLARKSAH